MAVSITRGLFTCARTDWETPAALFTALQREFRFTLDVCATSVNHKCSRYFTASQNGLAHEMLHHRPGEPALSKTVRETKAEAVAYVICRGVGLETNTAAADYIALYNGDKKTLAHSLSTIQKVSSQILKELVPEERLRQTPENAFDVQDPHVATTHPTSNLSSHRPQLEAPPAPEPGDSVSWDR